MERTTLQAEVRTTRGKGPARRLRMEGKIPAVYYGPGLDPTPLVLSPKDLIRALKGERGRNTLFALSVDGKEELVMVKDLEVDPVSRALLHVDFYKVSLTRPIEVEVPFKVTGRAIGVVKGGTLNVTRRSLPLRTTPEKIPASVEVDVTKLDLHQTIAVQDVPLDEGVTCTLRPELTLAAVLETRVVEEKAPEEEAVAEGTATEEAPKA